MLAHLRLAERPQAALLGRLHSASYFPKSGPVKDELEATLRRLFAEHQRDGFVTMVQRTELTLADVVKEEGTEGLRD